MPGCLRTRRSAHLGFYFKRSTLRAIWQLAASGFHVRLAAVRHRSGPAFVPSCPDPPWPRKSTHADTSSQGILPFSARECRPSEPFLVMDFKSSFEIAPSRSRGLASAALPSETICGEPQFAATERAGIPAAAVRPTDRADGGPRTRRGGTRGRRGRR